MPRRICASDQYFFFFVCVFVVQIHHQRNIPTNGKQNRNAENEKERTKNEKK